MGKMLGVVNVSGGVLSMLQLPLRSLISSDDDFKYIGYTVCIAMVCCLPILYIARKVERLGQYNHLKMVCEKPFYGSLSLEEI